MKQVLIFIFVLFFSSSSCGNFDAIKQCRTIYSDILAKRDLVLLPGLQSIDHPDEYLKFIRNNYEYIHRTDIEFRSCMKDSVNTVERVEGLTWIKAAVNLGRIETNWKRYIDSPEKYDLNDTNSKFIFEYRLNNDIDTFVSMNRVELTKK